MGSSVTPFAICWSSYWAIAGPYLHQPIVHIPEFTAQFVLDGV